MSKKQQQNDSSKIVQISELQEQYQDSSLKIQVEAYQTKNFELHERIQQLEQMLQDKMNEINHLKKLLDESVPTFVPNFNVSDEEVIAIKQLERLKEASQIRPLSLEEIRMYDLLVKNKRLAQGDSTNIVDTVKLPKEKNKLLEIAAKKIDVQTEE